jgi:hypothetical protein
MRPWQKDPRMRASADPVPARRGWPIWQVALSVGLTALVLWVLVRALASLEEISRAAAGLDATLVGLGLGLAVLAMVLSALRWQIALRAMGYSLSLWRCLEVILATWPPVLITPGRANELLRAGAIRGQVPLAVGAGSILVEKAFDVLALLLTACAGAALARSWAILGLLLVTVLVGLAGLAVLWRSPRYLQGVPWLHKYRDKLERLAEAFSAMRRKPLLLVELEACSLAIRLLTILVIHVLLLAVDVHVPWYDTLALWPLAVIVGLLPVTIAGMGTRDAAFIYLLDSRGQSLGAADLLVATMAYSALVIWFFAVIGLPFMVRELLRSRAGRAPEADNAARSE